MNQTTTQIDVVTQTLEVPGAVLTYDVRENASSTRVPLMIIGSPMGAAGFVSLAGHFSDRTVITYDPRGVDRSTRTDESMTSSPDVHADDVHRVIEAARYGPVELFASSGGAVNALALVTHHPEDVRTLVAHEPPLAGILPDREAALAAVRSIGDTYQRKGFGAGMAKFMAVTSIRGPIPADVANQPDPDPAMFGMPAEDDGSRNDVMLSQNIIPTTHYQPDFDALKQSSTRIVMAAGEESEGEMANRGAHAVADQLGTETIAFPSHHGGFLGGEYGWPGKPDEFAAKLHEVLDD